MINRKFIFDNNFLKIIGLEENRSYRITELRTFMKKKKIIFYRGKNIYLSNNLVKKLEKDDYNFYKKYSLKYFMSFLREQTIEKDMNKNIFLLQSSDFIFLKVIEL